MYFTKKYRHGTTNLVHYIICYPTYPLKNQSFREYPFYKKKPLGLFTRAALE